MLDREESSLQHIPLKSFKDLLRSLHLLLALAIKSVIASFMLTETEIASRLDLEPSEIFEQKSIDQRSYPRRSGRTTKMLIAAVAAAQIEKVGIAAYSKSLTRMFVIQAREMCAQLGIDPYNIVEYYPPPNLERMRGTDEKARVQVFYDHYLGPRFPNS